MANLKSLKANATASVIVYGAPKTGKTLIAGELAEHFKLIYVGMENGHDTLFQLPEAWQENIELVNLPDTRDYPIAIETVLKMVKGPVVICEAHGKVNCMICKRAEAEVINTNLPALDHNTIVIFDSLTQLTNSAIAHITKGKPDDYKLDYDDWGNLGKLLDIFLSHLQQARYNVVVISHEAEVETEGKKKTLVPVGGTRNFSRNVAKYFGHVVYAERKNKKHVFSCSSTYATTIMTGSRTAVEVEAMDKPSLLSIFKPQASVATAIASADTKMIASNVAGIKAKSTAPAVKTERASTADILARLKAKKA